MSRFFSSRFLCHVKFFLFILGVVIIVGYGVTMNLDNHNSTLKALTLENIEALSVNENSGSKCSGGKCEAIDSRGNSCSACCEEGYSPRCTRYDGCSCY